jgi:hypothetical protein
MMEIERHWRGGNQERAAKLFELLKTRFPNFEFENAESGWFEQLQATLDADAP